MFERTGKPAAVKTTLSVNASPVIRVCTIGSPRQVATQQNSHRLRSRRLRWQRFLQLILGKLTFNPSEFLLGIISTCPLDLRTPLTEAPFPPLPYRLHTQAH